jgi:hypothetical protein
VLIAGCGLKGLRIDDRWIADCGLWIAIVDCNCRLQLSIASFDFGLLTWFLLPAAESAVLIKAAH